MKTAGIVIAAVVMLVGAVAIGYVIGDRTGRGAVRLPPWFTAEGCGIAINTDIQELQDRVDSEPGQGHFFLDFDFARSFVACGDHWEAAFHQTIEGLDCSLLDRFWQQTDPESRLVGVVESALSQCLSSG